jgi:DNA-binding CsgD family transcriptional regulator/tetratricopeptide (TPR) repeat protein
MEWPLVGREVAMRQLTATLDRDPGIALAIVGDAGVGKTRLAAELGRWALESGRAVEAVVASPSAVPIPFGALSHLVSLPSASQDQSHLMGRLLAELRRRPSEGGPLVLTVDDAHHLDEHSSVLLHQAAVHRVASIVLTLRTGETVPPFLTQLWKDRAAERIVIGPLTRETTTLLVEKVLDGPVDRLLASELWQRSGGNPLFLRELILGGLESGALISDAGLWRAHRPLAPSSRLAELVVSRLGRLKPAEQAIVEALAVAGSIDLSDLEALGDRRSIESLEEHRLVEVHQSGNRHWVTLAHPIYGEVIAADLPRTRVRRIMRALAEQLEKSGTRRPDDVLRLALWRIEGGGAIDPEHLVAAARRALAAFDAPLAERLARAALTDARGGVAAGVLLGRAMASQQRVEEADQVLAAAVAQARTDGEIAEASLARANLLYFGAGRAEEASRILTDAHDRLSDADWRDEIDSLLTLFRAAAGQLQSVAASGRRLTQRTGARPRAVVHTLLYASIANVMLGRFGDAEEQVRIGLELAPDVAEELPLAGDMLRINGVMAHAYAGRSRRALELGLRGHAAALDARVPELAAMWAMNLAECQMLAGDVRAALRTMLEALAGARVHDPFAVHGIDAAVASICATWLGRHELARELRQEVLDLGLARDVRSRIWLDRATVWTTWGEAGAEPAAAAAMDAADGAVRDTHLVWGAWLYHDAARLGLAGPAAPSLATLASRIEGELVSAMSLHASALAGSDALGLERAASAFDQLGSHLFAAEAAAQAQQAYLRQGRARLARVAAARASLLGAQCPGVQTPALAEVAPVPLTRRELEIARLAADGRSSRELAERLGISVRTVDNHLGTVYAKLGVSTREELPSVIGTRRSEGQ